MVVAIDGPAGAGKSTVAREVARALGFTYLDTGAMYRAAALAALRGRDDVADLDIEVGDRVLLDGEDVTEAIRTPEVSEAASRLAGRPEVRAALVDKERARRRAEELGLPVEQVLAELGERDARDSGHGRTIDGPAPGAVALDTTG